MDGFPLGWTGFLSDGLVGSPCSPRDSQQSSPTPQFKSINQLIQYVGFPGGSVVKNLPTNAGEVGSTWVRKIPWRRKWQPTPVVLPGESHGQRSLKGYSPWGCKRVRHDLVTKQQ